MKTAVITGSTKGIGKSIGRKLLEEGCFVVFNYSSGKENAMLLQEEIEPNYAGKYVIIQSDLSTFEGMNQFFQTCLTYIQSVDYLILNAGQTDRTSFENMIPESFLQVMNTNVHIPVFLIQKFDPLICPHGRIVFTGSIMGQYPHAMSLAYGVSKAAVQFLAKNLVKQFADRAITVNAVCPGFVDTPWQRAKAPEIRARIEDKIALHRFASPKEIADFIYAVLQNDYVNGAILNIDGGYDYQ